MPDGVVGRGRGGGDRQENVILPPAEIHDLEAAYAVGDDARVVRIEDAVLDAIDPAPFFDPWRVSVLASRWPGAPATVRP